VCFRNEPDSRRPFTRGSFEPRFRDSQRHRPLDPRPRSPSRTAVLARSVDKRFSGSDCRPTTSATTLPTHGHTPEHPILAVIRRSALRDNPEIALTSHQACYGLVTFPCRRRVASAASCDSPFGTIRTALQARRKGRPRMPPTNRNAACGRRLDPTIVCGDGRWPTTLNCAGRVALSEGPSHHAVCCRRTTRRKFPSSFELLEHPYASSIRRPEGWMLPPSS